MCLDLGESHFNGIEVRGIRRQEQEPCAFVFQDFSGSGAFVNGKDIASLTVGSKMTTSLADSVGASWLDLPRKSGEAFFAYAAIRSN
jgi:hypothetical protein